MNPQIIAIVKQKARQSVYPALPAGLVPVPRNHGKYDIFITF